MTEILKALKYKNIDEARAAMRQISIDSPGMFDDGGEEPTGLLSVIPEDRLPEEDFYRLFDIKKGALIEVEKIPYSGFGPPAAQEEEYMGFVTEGVCYVMKGCGLPIEIENCPQGARDIHHLEALVLDRMHPLDRGHLAEKLHLSPNWEFEDLFDLICQGRITAQQLDRLIHRGIH